MRYRVLFHPEARNEALAAAEYIAQHSSPEVALHWYDGLEATIASLESMPSRCSHARESEAFPQIELRQIIHQSHRLIFVIHQNEVHILHVRHAAQASLDFMPDDE